MTERSYDLTLASAPLIAVTHVGQEAQPVIQLDGVSRHPEELVRFATDNGGFSNDMSGLYPGPRAALPLAYADALIQRLDPLIRSSFKLGPVKLARADCVFSMVTKAPDALVPFQRIPHIDTTNPLHFAALHFLCDERFGGTAFFRQRETGFEGITPEREAAYEAARDRQFAEEDNANSGYIDGDTRWYQRIGQCDARWNRLILYRSNLLHSGRIDDPTLLSDDPAKGRLTANIFIGYRPVG